MTEPLIKSRVAVRNLLGLLLRIDGQVAQLYPRNANACVDLPAPSAVVLMDAVAGTLQLHYTTHAIR